MSFKYALATSPSRCTRGRRLQALTPMLCVFCFCGCLSADGAYRGPQLWVVHYTNSVSIPLLQAKWQGIDCPSAKLSLGFPLLPCETASLSIRLHGLVLMTTGIRCIWWNSGAPRLHCFRSTQVSADFRVDIPCESYSRAVGRGCYCLRLPVGIRSGLPLTVYTFAPAWYLSCAEML